MSQTTTTTVTTPPKSSMTGTLTVPLLYGSKDSASSSADNHFESVLVGTAGNYLRPYVEKMVTVHDMRDRAIKSFSLDKEGFQLESHISSERDFIDNEAIKSKVYPECAELLRNITGATRVHPFSHLVRRDLWEDAIAAASASADPTTPIPMLPPARRAHIDQSFAGASHVLQDNMSADDATRLSRSRWGIINVWRPLNPVTRDPLTVCDSRSVDQAADLAELEVKLGKDTNGKFSNVSKGKTFELFEIRHNPQHQWWYASGMTEKEVLVLKIFDTKKTSEGRWTAVPHCSFPFPGQVDGGRPRESIEVRCLVFWEGESLE